MSYEVAVIVGSLRRGSLNRLLAQAAAEVAPSILSLTEVPIEDVPHYNGDHDIDPQPAAVAELKAAIAAADAVLVFTPEFNHSIPGPLKNAIDWLSRPAFAGPLVDKPAAVVGLTPSERNEPRRVVEETSLVLAVCAAKVMTEPVLAFGRGKLLFDDEGALVDTEARQRLATHMAAFADHVEAVVEGGTGTGGA